MSTIFQGMRSSCLAALLVACTAGSAPAADEPLDLMVDKPDVVALVQVGELLKSPGFKQLASDKPEINAKLDEPLGKKTKLTMRDLKSVFVSAVTSKQEFAVVITTSKDIGPDDVTPDEGATKETVGDYEVYVQADDKAVCLIDERTVMMAPTAVLKAILKRDDDAETTDEFEAVWEEVDDEKPVYVAATLGPLMQLAGAALPPNFPLAPPVLQKIRSGTLSAGASDGVEIALDLDCTDAETAMQLKSLIDVVVQTQAGAATTPPPIRSLLGGIKAGTDEEFLTIDVKAGIDVLLTLGMMGTPAPNAAAPPPAPPKP